jgi:hypothetical protein
LEDTEKGNDLLFWVDHTGATCHMVCKDEGMSDCISSNQHVFEGDGRALEVKKVRKLQVKFTGRDQKTTDVLLEDVKFIPSLKSNLFSLLVALKKGVQIRSEGTNLTVVLTTKLKFEEEFWCVERKLSQTMLSF